MDGRNYFEKHLKSTSVLYWSIKTETNFLILDEKPAQKIFMKLVLKIGFKVLYDFWPTLYKLEDCREEKIKTWVYKEKILCCHISLL